MEVANQLIGPYYNIIQFSLVILGGLGIWSLTFKSISYSVERDVIQRKTVSISGIRNEGNTCFMNSVVQSIVSLEEVVDYLNYHNRNHFDDTVTYQLYQLAQSLQPTNEPTTLRAIHLVTALQRHGSRLFTYAQQDAQEFFQHLSSALSKENQTRLGLGLVSLDSSIFEHHTNSTTNGHHTDSIPPISVVLKTGRVQIPIPRFQKSPLVGLLASRISCLFCKHQSPWRHETFDNLSITIPHEQCRLLDAIKTYTRPEFIDGYICSYCSFMETRKRLKKVEYQKYLDACLELNNFDVPLVFNTNEPKGLELIKVNRKVAKETKIAYAPKCLCLHMQRSVYLPSGHLVKNNSIVEVMEVLDINELVLGKMSLPNFQSAFKSKTDTMPTFQSTSKSTTENSSTLNTVTENSSTLKTESIPRVSMDCYHDEMSNYLPPLTPSQKSQMIDSLTEDLDQPTLEIIEPPPLFEPPKRPFIYNLAALILHYGHHDAGHFIAIRKVKYKTQTGIKSAWFRVSDATVDRMDISDVLEHGSRFCYMLFYERQ